MSVRETAISFALVAFATGEVLADEAREVGGVVASEATEETALDIEVALERDFDLVFSVGRGSPVRTRAQARRRHLRSESNQRLAKALKDFRKTQTGPFDRVIAREAERWGVEPFLFKGLLINESKLDPKLTGRRIYERVGKRRRAVGGGARGIAQFTHSGVSAVNEARQRRYYWGERVEPFRREDVWDVEASIAAAAELLSHYIERFGRDGGVTAYNTGPYGGRLVERHGFFGARSGGKLSRVGGTRLQGHRFLLNVLREANQLRRDAGVSPLPGPDRHPRRKPSKERHWEKRSDRPSS